MREQEALLDHFGASSKARSSEKARKALWRPVLRSRSQVQSPGLMDKPVSIAVPADKNRTTPNASAGLVRDQPRCYDVDSSTHRVRRRVLEDVVSTNLDSSISGYSSHVRVQGEGTYQVDPISRPPDVGEPSSMAFSYDNEASILEDPERLASIWQSGPGVQIPFPGANAGTRHLHSNGSCECQSKLSCDCSWGFIETVMISLLYLAYRGEQ